MAGPLTITTEDLKRLSAADAVAFLSELLWAEAASCGVAKNLINVPTAITIGDGGVDAEVKDAIPTAGQGVIKQGNTCYQIKTGPFSLSDDGNIRSIIFKPRKSELNTRVKSCLDKGGTLVVVLFGWDGPDKKDDDIISAFSAKLTAVDASYRTVKVEVWRPNQLISFLEPYPSLKIRLLGGELRPFSTHSTWSRFADMRPELQIGPEQQGFIDALQEALRQTIDPTHVRVIEEPGIGKTRLVLEALRTDDLSPLVLYCQTPKHVLESDLLTQMLLRNSQINSVLVVDECDALSKADLWNRLQAVSPQVKLITIYSEPDPATGTTTYLNPPLLGNDQIAEIIANYGFPADQAARWVPFCSGSPRAAHVIGHNLRSNPEDLLRPLDTVPVWERYIAGHEPLEGRIYQDRLRVLRWLSLFKRFGYERPYDQEGRLIGKKIEQEEGVTWREFQRIVRDLRARKILQGDATLYITPKLLHIWLWTQWWETYGHANRFDLDEFQTIDPTAQPPVKLNDQLMEWFNEMFRYAEGSDVATKVVRDLLGADGIFSFGFLDTRRGSLLFQFLTEADPKSALVCLKRVLRPLSPEVLSQFQVGRRNVVYSLEMICMWRKLFPEGARLLLALAEAENERWSNNATGIFTGLFSPAYGAAAPTEAPPSDRLPILMEALNSSSKVRREIGLRACSAALETRHFSRIVGSEHQGLHKVPTLWMPETYKELFDAYQAVWKILASKIDDLPAEEQQEAVKVLLDHARGLSTMGDLGIMVTETLNGLVQRHDTYRQQTLAIAAQVLHYDGKRLTEEVMSRWETLRHTLTGVDFSSLLQRYVGMKLIVDNFDQTGKYVDRTQNKIEDLARQAVKEPYLLANELHWLVTDKAVEGYRFGYELGKYDDNFKLLPQLLTAQRNATEQPSRFFLGGYFRAIKESDIDRWETQLDIISDDSQLKESIPELTWRSGDLTDRAAIRVLALISEGTLNSHCFQIFAMGNVTSKLSGDVFVKWIDYLLALSDTPNVAIALDLYYSYYFSHGVERRMPQEKTLRLLLDSALFENANPAYQNQMTEFYWTEIAKHYVKLYPEGSLPLAIKMVENIGMATAITGDAYSSTRQVLNTITRKFPEQVWDVVKQHLGPPIDSHAFNLGLWLHGEIIFVPTAEAIETGEESADAVHGAMTLFPQEYLWQWVEQDINSRARYIARLVPKTLLRQKGELSLAREVLVRYGNRQDVRTEMFANYVSGGWVGPESNYYEQIKAELLDFKAKEKNENVLLWIDEYIDSLDAEIRHARAREERRYG